MVTRRSSPWGGDNARSAATGRTSPAGPEFPY